MADLHNLFLVTVTTLLNRLSCRQFVISTGYTNNQLEMTRKNKSVPYHHAIKREVQTCTLLTLTLDGGPEDKTATSDHFTTKDAV
jgi:hypothetical protein